MSGPASVYPAESIWSVRRRRQDPVAFLERLAARGDIVPFSLAGHAAVLLNHPDHVEDALVLNHARFTKPPALRRSGALLGTGLLTAEGELHQQRRRIAQPAFSPNRLDGYGAVIAQAARRAGDRWSDGDTIDMAAAMQALTMEIIGRLLFGADLSAHAREIGRAMASAAASIDPLLSLLAPRRRLRPAGNYLRTIVDRLIDERCASGAMDDDMVSVLRRAEGSEGQPATDQLRDDVLTLFVAGHDTIANALIWTWHALGRHAHVEARLREELCRKDGTYANWVLAESLRLYPPAWVITRRALEDHEIGGTTIPAGAIVVVSQYLLHRDARFFADPLAFRPERWDGDSQPARPRLAYFPFGAGPRSCIGQGLAMIEGPLVLATLAADWRCRPLAPIDVDPRATLRPRGPVMMKVDRVRRD